ncbi:MAG: response regulator transcription factor [Streptococcaceae bacterium]|jgi:two-component system alkaline phosphatase synthesis response regulator PhoP|nr:response regulator transcription factor [Streptococcaceae bacterium]
MKKILVVDDEESIVTLLKYNLEKEGYAVDTANDGQTAFEMAKNMSYDFFLFDIMMPGIDGMDLTRRLRQDKINTPILILTAKDDQIEKIIGLEIGADDYLTKPFSPREVIARMKAIFRRMEMSHTSETQLEEDFGKEKESILKVGAITLDPNLFTVHIHGKEVEVTPKEYEILRYFMRRVGRTIPREILLERMWDFDFDGTTRIVDVHISHLREKIEVNPKEPKYLQTVRGFGYRMNPIEEEHEKNE